MDDALSCEWSVVFGIIPFLWIMLVIGKGSQRVSYSSKTLYNTLYPSYSGHYIGRYCAGIASGIHILRQAEIE